jgi:hypothetical protein
VNPIVQLTTNAAKSDGPGPRSIAAFFRAAGWPKGQERTAGQRYAGKDPVPVPADRYQGCRAVFALLNRDLERAFVLWQRELSTPPHLRGEGVAP